MNNYCAILLCFWYFRSLRSMFIPYLYSPGCLYFFMMMVIFVFVTYYQFFLSTTLSIHLLLHRNLLLLPLPLIPKADYNNSLVFTNFLILTSHYFEMLWFWFNLVNGCPQTNMLDIVTDTPKGTEHQQLDMYHKVWCIYYDSYAQATVKTT